MSNILSMIEPPSLDHILDHICFNWEVRIRARTDLLSIWPTISDKTLLRFTDLWNVQIAKSPPYPLSKWTEVQTEGLSGRFWRTLGLLLQRPDIYKKGLHWELVSPSLPYGKIELRTISLQEYGWQATSTGQYRIICGYDEETDTLWIKR